MEGVILRRVIPSDNSCLFNAVGYAMDHDKNKAPELRQVIAATVISDPTKYSEAFLGKPNEEYCAWILDSEKWGGAIELSILADYYGREIAAYDIQTTRCDLYGQERKYSERVLLIYDGLHYDALAVWCSFITLPLFYDTKCLPLRMLQRSLIRQYLLYGRTGPLAQLRGSLIILLRINKGKGAILTLLISLCVVEYAKLESSARRKLWSMHKQQAMSTFKNTNERGFEMPTF